MSRNETEKGERRAEPYLRKSRNRRSTLRCGSREFSIIFTEFASCYHISWSKGSFIEICNARFRNARSQWYLYARPPTPRLASMWGFLQTVSLLHFLENMEMSCWSRTEFRPSSFWLSLWLMLSLGWDFTCYYLHIAEWKSRRSSLLSCLFYARPPALKVPFFSEQLNDKLSKMIG